MHNFSRRDQHFSFLAQGASTRGCLCGAGSESCVLLCWCVGPPLTETGLAARLKEGKKKFKMLICGSTLNSPSATIAQDFILDYRFLLLHARFDLMTNDCKRPNTLRHERALSIPRLLTFSVAKPQYSTDEAGRSIRHVSLQHFLALPHDVVKGGGGVDVTHEHTGTRIDVTCSHAA